MTEHIEYLKFIAVLCIGCGMFLVMLTVVALQPFKLSMLMKPSVDFSDKVRKLLSEIRFELTVPTLHYEVTDIPRLPPNVDRLNYIATRLRKHVERKVFEYIEQCSYVDRAIWLRKPRVVTEINDECIVLTVYGVRRVVIHTVTLMPSEFAHATVYFKNTICK